MSYLESASVELGSRSTQRRKIPQWARIQRPGLCNISVGSRFDPELVCVGRQLWAGLMLRNLGNEAPLTNAFPEEDDADFPDGVRHKMAASMRHRISSQFGRLRGEGQRTTETGHPIGFPESMILSLHMSYSSWGFCERRRPRQEWRDPRRGRAALVIIR